MNGSATTGADLSETKLIGEWLWPRSDERCASFVWARLPDLHQAMALLKRFEIVVQAGGNCGVWPAELAKRFATVYTFEADPLNFRCLTANVPRENVFKFNAALGYERGCIDLERTLNCGGHRVGGAGRIPMLRIDDLALPGCDFIQLDIEGHEVHALRGASDTVLQYQPVIMIEDKTFNRRAIERGEGIDKASSQCSRLLREWGYEVAAYWNSDFLYTWRG